MYQSKVDRSGRSAIVDPVAELSVTRAPASLQVKDIKQDPTIAMLYSINMTEMQPLGPVLPIYHSIQ